MASPLLVKKKTLGWLASRPQTPNPPPPLNVIMTLTVGKMICESPLILSLSFLCSSVYEALFALSFSFLSERFSLCLIHSQKKYLLESFLSKRILELKCCLGSGIFTPAVERGVAPHTRKQRVQAAISKLRSAFFKGYKEKKLHVLYIIGERAKRARHSQVCSIELRIADILYLISRVRVEYVIVKARQ